MPSVVRMACRAVWLAVSNVWKGADVDVKSWAAHETGGASEDTWANMETAGGNPTTWADLT